MLQSRILRRSRLQAISITKYTIRTDAHLARSNYSDRRQQFIGRYSDTWRGGFGRSSKGLDSHLASLLPLLPSGEYDARKIAMMKSRTKDGRPSKSSTQSKRSKLASRVGEGTPAEVLYYEARTLLEKRRSESASEKTLEQIEQESADQQRGKAESQVELELEVEELCSTGDGLAYSPEHDRIYVIPFSVPGDRVLAKTYPQKQNDVYTSLDFIKVLRPSPKREGITPGCEHFSKCSGCQLQMLSYDDQLKHKKTIVEKAFERFSNLDPSLIPKVGDTIGSPLQYSYRTKLTPHYDSMPKNKKENRSDQPPRIGFCVKNTRFTMDIEQCPIATPILNEGMKIERKRVHEKYHGNPGGATILLRESTSRKRTTTGGSPPGSVQTQKPKSLIIGDESSSTSGIATGNESPSSIVLPHPVPTSTELSYDAQGMPRIINTYPTHVDTKTYISQNNALATEYIGDFSFQTVANSFFQNNNSILPGFLNYVRDNCIPQTKPTSESTTTTPDLPIKYLLDAYCGSGLFAVALSPLFSSVLGIDVDVRGIEAARINAQNNGVPNAGFIAADADQLFADVPFPPDQTMVVIDPPRKGASIDFLSQLCHFGPKRVVYVSCNVHTQARDVGYLVQGFGAKYRYEIQSLRGFDFFPQTGHVEGLCFLDRVPDAIEKDVVESAEPTAEVGKAP